MTEKTRADQTLVQRGFFTSREKAQAAIMAGNVYVGERKVLKASEMIRAEEEIIVRSPAHDYVSRGALKLLKAISVFEADLHNKVIIDIGASTGGFTEVCLRNGARRVYSVDVGYGQLDWKLRNDPRVTVMERTNARYLKKDDFDEQPEIAVMDVSFISVKLILPAAISVIGDEGVFYTLIKPQFEAGKEKVGKKGVVRDPDTHKEVLNSIIQFAEMIGWHVEKLDYSPITGPEGNIEFLAKIVHREKETDDPISDDELGKIVMNAHEKMKKND